MEDFSKSVLPLIPPDINGEEVLICSSNLMEWRGLIDAFRKVATLTLCTTNENVPPLTGCQHIAPRDLGKDQFKNRFFAVLFFDPISNDLAIDILNKTSLSLLSDEGYVSCIQSCRHLDTYDQTEVRDIEKLLKDVRFEGTEFCLQFVSGKLLQNQNKAFYCTVQKKAVLDSRNFIGTDSFQNVMNDQVYSTDVIQMYEALYGKNFMSTGASKYIEEELESLKIQPNAKILDVGSGLGGFSFLIAKKYEADVYGTDLCMNLVEQSKQTSIRMTHLKVDFEVCDISCRNFPEASFDVIFSKDVIYHVKDKHSLYKKFQLWLKPGGKLLVADFNRTEDEMSEEFKAYLKFRKNTWYLLTLKEYKQCILDAGFINVNVKDVSSLQTNTIKEEYEEIKNNRHKFIKEFGEEYYNRWLSKLETKYRITQSGDHSWGMFYGEKHE